MMFSVLLRRREMVIETESCGISQAKEKGFMMLDRVENPGMGERNLPQKAFERYL